MKNLQTRKLTGRALDYAVACTQEAVLPALVRQILYVPAAYAYRPSQDWAQGGPLLERYRIAPQPAGRHWAVQDVAGRRYPGRTPLIAGMRALVALMYGDNIKLPSELFNGETRNADTTAEG